MSDIYSASQIVDKTLFAAKPVQIYRDINKYYAGAKGVFTVAVGNAVGKVYGYVQRGTDLWWQFYDSYGQPYWTLHREGVYSQKAVQQQGAKDTEQEQKEALADANKDLPWYERLLKEAFSKKNIVMVGLGLAAVYLAGQYINKKVK
jgi:hypothetical protein